MPTVLELYEKLKPRLGEQEARSLLEYIDTSVEHRAATKSDLERIEAAMKSDLERVETAMKSDLERVETAMKSDLERVTTALKAELERVTTALKAELREDIHGVKVDLLKWSFAFWVGNVAVVAGIIFALLRTAGR